MDEYKQKVQSPAWPKEQYEAQHKVNSIYEQCKNSFKEMENTMRCLGTPERMLHRGASFVLATAF